MTDKVLGCKAFELEVGTEFSRDEGRTWLVVRTEPTYLNGLLTDEHFVIQCSPKESPLMWEEVILEDSDHVLLERDWKGE